MISLLSLVDVTSVAFVAGGSLLPVISTRGVGKGEVKEGLQRVVMPVGVMGTMFGVILMLMNMSDPEAIWPAMSVAMLTSFYGLGAYVLLRFLPQKSSEYGFEGIVRPSIHGSALIGLLLMSFFIYHGSVSWIDMPSFALIAGGVWLSTLVFHKWNPLIPKSYLVVRHSALLSVLAMLYASFYIYQNLSDPSLIGPSMAFGLVSALYASILMGCGSLVVPKAYLRRVYGIQIAYLISMTTSIVLLFTLIQMTFT